MTALRSSRIPYDDARHRYGLTDHECDVLWAQLVIDSHKAAGQRYGISASAVGAVLSSVYRKTGATSPGEAAVLLGWLRHPRPKLTVHDGTKLTLGL